VETKEECEMTLRKDTRARISYQRFFRRYLKLGGMTGTAQEVAGELYAIYGLKVVSIPTHRPIHRHYLPDRIHSTEAKKWEAVVKAVSDVHSKGRPVLVGTRSVEASELLSRLLDESGLTHSVLNARQDEEEAEIITQAGQEGRITVATNMAGRGTDIKLGPNVPELGGLHVIATERHEAGRIDRQLFGRCGRQGDPGSCAVMVSLEDELITFFYRSTTLWFASFFVRFPGGVLSRMLGKMLFRRAQRAAERMHAGIRNDLLKSDEQLSESLAFAGQAE
jgi:preprotein translocase subunit SecA